MSRFLFVTLPLPGHAYPAVAVARAVRERGHDVAWAGSETFLRPLVGADATVYSTGMRPYRGQRDRGARSVKSLWEGFVVPFAKFTVPAVEKAVRAYQPDVLVADQHALAGALVAHRNGLPWASLVVSQLELTRPFRAFPKVESWIEANLSAVWTAAGLAGEPAIDLRFSPHLVLVTGPALAREAMPDQYRLIGPALGGRPPEAGFEWHGRDPSRHGVMVTMGTMSQDVSADFYRRAVSALRPLADRLQAIIVAPPEALPDPPPHLQVIPRVPTLELMPYVDAVVCHGGQGTVCEALAHGVPLVTAPIRTDQPIVAQQVAQAGAGVRLHFSRSRPDQLRSAILTVLDDPTYRSAAKRIGDTFPGLGGAPAAAGHLADLASAPAGCGGRIRS